MVDVIGLNWTIFEKILASLIQSNFYFTNHIFVATFFFVTLVNGGEGEMKLFVTDERLDNLPANSR